MGILDFLLGRKTIKSAEQAKIRLNLTLQYERRQLPPNFTERLKADLIKVFRNYPQFDAENIDVSIQRLPSTGNTITEELRISIPFKG